MRKYANNEIRSIRRPDNKENKNDGSKLDQKLRELGKVYAKNDVGRRTGDIPSKNTDYSRPKWREGMRDEVWKRAKDAHGRVRDPVTGKYMSKDKDWDMGHKPGHEFSKHQKSAIERGISREQFIDEYNNPENVRPELPSSNRSHKGENKTGEYFGD